MPHGFPLPLGDNDPLGGVLAEIERVLRRRCGIVIERDRFELDHGLLLEHVTRSAKRL